MSVRGSICDRGSNADIDRGAQIDFVHTSSHNAFITGLFTSFGSFVFQFSLLSEDGLALDCSTIDSSYSRLRRSICDIVEDSLLESSVEGTDGDRTGSADDTLGNDEEPTGGLFTQTYRCGVC